MILRRLSEASSLQGQAVPEPKVHEKLLGKGLPAEAFSKLSSFLKFWAHKIWNFMLEAKDLKPHAAAGYRMKKIFNDRLPMFKKPAAPPPLTFHKEIDEQHYLDIIKLDPKNLANYDALGKYYLDEKSHEDARDIYLYLASHQPNNPEYHARLAFCFYQSKMFDKAAEHYKKSLALDSTQPNRYYNLALSLEADGKIDEALRNFEKAIALEPTSGKYYLSLGNAYLKAGDMTKAREALASGMRADPNNQAIEDRMEKIR